MLQQKYNKLSFLCNITKRKTQKTMKPLFYLVFVTCSKIGNNLNVVYTLNTSNLDV